MKRILILTILFVGFAGLMQAQTKKSDVPFKNCNTIQVLKQGYSDSLLVQFAHFLEKEGYKVSRMNKKNTNFRTTPFNLISQKLNNAIIHVLAPADTSKHLISITAFTKPGEYGASPYKMKNHNSKLTENGMLFNEVAFLAKKFADTYHCQVLYVKSKH